MKVELSPRARVELTEILEYYAAQQPGLNAQFLAEFERASRQLGRFPETGPVMGRRISYRHKSRRLIIRRFPYLLIYSVAPARVTIVAIAHQSRRSSYWRSRVEESAPCYVINWCQTPINDPKRETGNTHPIQLDSRLECGVSMPAWPEQLRAKQRKSIGRPWH
jgi:plasmid stabilization system protein ParE